MVIGCRLFIRFVMVFLIMIMRCRSSLGEGIVYVY